MRKVNILYLLLSIGICSSFGMAVLYLSKSLANVISINNEEIIPSYDYHFVLIGQEIDNPYFQTIFEGAQAAANEKNIYDTDLDESKRLAYIGTNNYEAGYEMGMELIKDTDGQAHVGIITGFLYSNNLVLRVQGFLDAIEEAPNVKVVAIESSNISSSQAADKAHQMLRKYPEITVFFGTSALDGLGISQAINKINPASPILVYAFDDLEETLELIKNDKIQATVQQNQYEMGYKGVVLLYDAINGVQIPSTFYTPTKILRKNDLEE